jgi:hypothetical protein
MVKIDGREPEYRETWMAIESVSESVVRDIMVPKTALRARLREAIHVKLGVPRDQRVRTLVWRVSYCRGLWTWYAIGGWDRVHQGNVMRTQRRLGWN